MDQVPECRPELVQAYADDQLGLTESLQLERHLGCCARCSALYENQKALGKLIAQSGLYHRAPPGLLDRIEHSLGGSERTPLPAPVAPREYFWRGLALAASAAFLIVLSTTAIMRHQLAAPEDPALHDVVSNHIRSLMANHLADVASSDQHTVKPWFSGKLNFSPPVSDFAQQGFPLIGGRVDVVDDQPVAALIYRRNKHYINLFVWPSSRGPQPRQATSLRGYNVIHWTQSGLNYWAISDVSRTALETFASLIRNSS